MTQLHKPLCSVWQYWPIDIFNDIADVKCQTCVVADHGNSTDCRLHSSTAVVIYHAVIFVIDAGLPDHVKTITLSYTFFELGLGGTPPAPKSKVLL